MEKSSLYMLKEIKMKLAFLLFHATEHISHSYPQLATFYTTISALFD